MLPLFFADSRDARSVVSQQLFVKCFRTGSCNEIRQPLHSWQHRWSSLVDQLSGAAAIGQLQPAIRFRGAGMRLVSSIQAECIACDESLMAII